MAKLLIVVGTVLVVVPIAWLGWVSFGLYSTGSPVLYMIGVGVSVFALMLLQAWGKSAFTRSVLSRQQAAAADDAEADRSSVGNFLDDEDDEEQEQDRGLSRR